VVITFATENSWVYGFDAGGRLLIKTSVSKTAAQGLALTWLLVVRLFPAGSGCRKTRDPGMSGVGAPNGCAAIATFGRGWSSIPRQKPPPRFLLVPREDLNSGAIFLPHAI